MRHPLGQRIHAAQALGGFTSLEALARAINRAGFSAGTLRRIAAGAREAKDYELRWIAAACGVSESFFTADLERDFTEDASTPADERLNEILEIVRKLEPWESAPVWQRIVDARHQFTAAMDERLERIEQKLEKISPTPSSAERLALIEEERARQTRERHAQHAESRDSRDATGESA